MTSLAGVCVWLPSLCALLACAHRAPPVAGNGAPTPAARDEAAPPAERPADAPAAVTGPASAPNAPRSLPAFMMLGPYESEDEFCRWLAEQDEPPARVVERCTLTPWRPSKTITTLTGGVLVSEHSDGSKVYYAAARSDGRWFFAGHEAIFTTPARDGSSAIEGGFESMGFSGPGGPHLFFRGRVLERTGKSTTERAVFVLVGAGESREPACIGVQSLPSTGTASLSIAAPDADTLVVGEAAERMETSPAGRSPVAPGTYALDFQ